MHCFRFYSLRGYESTHICVGFQKHGFMCLDTFISAVPYIIKWF